MLNKYKQIKDFIDGFMKSHEVKLTRISEPYLRLNYEVDKKIESIDFIFNVEKNNENRVISLNLTDIDLEDHWQVHLLRFLTRLFGHDEPLLTMTVFTDGFEPDIEVSQFFSRIGEKLCDKDQLAVDFIISPSTLQRQNGGRCIRVDVVDAWNYDRLLWSEDIYAPPTTDHVTWLNARLADSIYESILENKDV